MKYPELQKIDKWILCTQKMPIHCMKILFQKIKTRNADGKICRDRQEIMNNNERLKNN
jgi:hypothetical protein